MTTTTEELSEDLEKMVVTKKRVRSKYFKQKVICPICYSESLKHHLKRHQQSKKCMFVRFAKAFYELKHQS